MRCARCHAENKEGRRFCGSCGAAMPAVCGACGFSNEPGAAFCGGCGTPLSRPTPSGPAPGLASPQAYTPVHLAERILSARGALEGERKQVTVLFADLKGSMELLANRDPEEARRLLDPVLERMMEAVHRYEGTVNQVMGDGIMALFGAPVAHEDHAVRAGYAALKMQAAIAAYGEQIQGQHDVTPQIRVGLNSGEVVVRQIGSDLRMDYSAVGQTTHLAARMEQLASPGSIVVTETFARLTEGYLHLKPLGLVAVKGLAEPIDVFQLVDAEPTRTRFQAAAARGLTRFVGRQTELDDLGQALERAGSGHGQAVAVIGEPGVGKSRLFYELIDSPRTNGWLVLETGSVSYGRVSAYLPLRDLLKTYFQIDDREDGAHVRERVSTRLVGLDQSLRGTLPALLALLDGSVDDPDWQALDPGQRRQRILDGVKRLLLRQSREKPLLLVFENLHWIDVETQAFLGSFIESLPTARILFLVNYRPEYQHGWGSKTYYTQIRLDPLPTESAEELLRGLLGDDPGLEPLKKLLIERTEGNPLFLEESIRTLVETKVLTGERGIRRLAKPLSSIQVPATVQAILAARIDRLSAEDKRLLQSAAVIGKDISFSLLQAIAGLSEAELSGGVAHLQTAEFLYETSLFPELEYTFKHALTQEVAYGSLLHEKRRALHARIVEAIETLHADRLANEVERLAHHAFRGELWEKAVVYFRQAGSKAAMHSAYREAVGCFEQALEALKRLPESPEMLQQAFDLRMELRPWLAPLGDYGRILNNLREAEALAEGQGDRRRLGLVYAYMTDYFRLTGQSQEAVRCGERAFRFATDLGDLALQVLANQFLGHAYHGVGDNRKAIPLLRRNLESLRGDLIRERFGSAALPSVFSRTFMVLSLVDLGEFAEALSIAEEAVRIAEEFDTAHSQVQAHHAVGLVKLLKGDFQQAIPVLEQTLVRCQVSHIPLGSRLLASALGYTYALSGRVEEAMPLLEQAVQQAEALRVVFRLALWLAWLGEAYLLGGRVEDARRLAARALERASAQQETGHRAHALRLLGDIAGHGDSPEVEKAELAYREALGLTEALGMRPLQAHCHLGVGLLHGRAGRPGQARAELATATALFHSMEMAFWGERAERLLAGV